VDAPAATVEVEEIGAEHMITNAWKGITQANDVQKAPMKSAFAVSRLVTSCTGLG